MGIMADLAQAGLGHAKGEKAVRIGENVAFEVLARKTVRDGVIVGVTVADGMWVLILVKQQV